MCSKHNRKFRVFINIYFVVYINITPLKEVNNRCNTYIIIFFSIPKSFYWNSVVGIDFSSFNDALSSSSMLSWNICLMNILLSVYSHTPQYWINTAASISMSKWPFSVRKTRFGKRRCSTFFFSKKPQGPCLVNVDTEVSFRNKQCNVSSCINMVKFLRNISTQDQSFSRRDPNKT